MVRAWLLVPMTTTSMFMTSLMMVKSTAKWVIVLDTAVTSHTLIGQAMGVSFNPILATMNCFTVSELTDSPVTSLLFADCYVR